MNIASNIQDIRNSSGLTQEEFAGKLFVTRQAVSRWETGETTPTIDTLKKIFDLFKVDANAFFDDKPLCQSCSMWFITLDDFGVNADETINADYCHYCFEKGKFAGDYTLEEFVEMNLKYLPEWNKENGTNFTVDEARDILKNQVFPSLKRWKK